MEEAAVETGGHMFGMTLGVFLLDMLIIFLFVAWFFMLIRVISDLFRRKDVSGWRKILWVLALVLVPYIGIFFYLLTQGWGMAERDVQQAEVARDHLRQVVGYSVADEIIKLDQLKASGSISEAEYTAMRARLVG